MLLTETVAFPAEYIPADIVSVSAKSVYPTSFSEPVNTICPLCKETSLSSKSTKTSTLELVLFQYALTTVPPTVVTVPTCADVGAVLSTTNVSSLPNCSVMFPALSFTSAVNSISLRSWPIYAFISALVTVSFFVPAVSSALVITSQSVLTVAQLFTAPFDFKRALIFIAPSNKVASVLVKGTSTSTFSFTLLKYPFRTTPPEVLTKDVFS